MEYNQARVFVDMAIRHFGDALPVDYDTEALRNASFAVLTPNSTHEQRDIFLSKIAQGIKQGKYTISELAEKADIELGEVREILTQFIVRQGDKRREQRSTEPIAQFIDKHGYIHTKVGKDYPGARKSGWILEHRRVLQEHLNRQLMPWEVVHHINHIKSDNRVVNLRVLTAHHHRYCVGCPYKPPDMA